jgi:hypothetical protein
VTSQIALTNSKLATFEANVMGKLVEVKDDLASIDTYLHQFLNKSHGSPSSEKTSHYEGYDSSNNMDFHSIFLHHDPHIPRVELKKFEGSDRT